MRLLLPVLLMTALLFSQNGRSQAINRPDSAWPACLQKANQLLDEAFSFMQRNYYRKSTVEWNSLMAAAKQKLAASGNCNDTYDIISGCFKTLNETHSFIMSPAKAAIYNNTAAGQQEKPAIKELVGDIKSELLENGIAYLTVPWVSTTDSVVCTLIADSLQQLISSLDARGAKSWIIDLRKNTGGNCWPMLAGIGPLLGDGICGYFVSAKEKIAISYKDGAASQGSHVRCRVSSNGYKLKDDKKSIIVLTGRRTVSSGEIVALAFKGKEQVYLYGEPTAGYTTANATYTLSDNSMLVLTVCLEADRTGKVCDGKIMPDEPIAADAMTGSGDPAKSAAIMWLTALRP